MAKWEAKQAWQVVADQVQKCILKGSDAPEWKYCPETKNSGCTFFLDVLVGGVRTFKDDADAGER